MDDNPYSPPRSMLNIGRYRIASIGGLTICLLVFGVTVLESQQQARQFQQQRILMRDAARQR